MKHLIVIIILIFALFEVKSQTVRNVNFSAQGNDIQITYDLIDNGQNSRGTIELYYSTNNGASWKGPINQCVSGDIGYNVNLGTNKKIIWQPLLSLPWLFSDYVMFKVVVKKPDFTETINNFNLDMVYVKGGTFIMGCTSEQGNDCYDNEKPIHEVTLSDFYIGKYEITLAQFKAFIDDTQYRTYAQNIGRSYIWSNGKMIESYGYIFWKCDERGNTRPQSDYNHPVIHVTWNDAVAFCEWLSYKTGKNYRLPTEAEWEYAARGGASTGSATATKYSGSNDINEVAWYSGNSDYKTHPVGQKKSNKLGIYDMTGNVWEWCNDWFGDYSSNKQINPIGPSSGLNRVLRGGGWDYGAKDCHISFHGNNHPNRSDGSNGFRVVLIP